MLGPVEVELEDHTVRLVELVAATLENGTRGALGAMAHEDRVAVPLEELPVECGLAGADVEDDAVFGAHGHLLGVSQIPAMTSIR
jgi:hypothetical protein